MKVRLAIAAALGLGGLASADEIPWRAAAPAFAPVGADSPTTEPPQSGLPMPQLAQQPAPPPVPQPAPPPASLPLTPGVVPVYPNGTHKIPDPADIGQSPNVKSVAVGSPPLTMVNEFGLGGTAPVPADLMYKTFFRAEYLLWWTKNDVTPPLVTTGVGTSTGALGQPGTAILFGGPVDLNPRSGARFSAGCWLDDCMTCGIDGSVFFLGSKGINQTFTSNEFPLLTRPFTSINPAVPATPAGQAVEFVAFPGLLAGSANVAYTSNLWGAEVNAREVCYRDCDTSFTPFVGFRYLDLKESLTVTELISVLQSNPPTPNQPTVPNPPGTAVDAFDRFSTHNQFYGGQLGAYYEQQFGRFFVDVIGKVGLGVTHQTVNIYGQAVVAVPGSPPQVFLGDLLTSPISNIGTFHKDPFTVVPELTLNLGYQFTPNFRAFVGYNFLYWSSVVRPGQQVDVVIDTALLPNQGTVTPTGFLRPGVLFKQTDYWAQGFNFGIEARW